MKQFFKYMFASMFGFIIAGIVLIFIVAAIIGSALQSAQSTSDISIKDNSILHLNFSDEINDKVSQNPFQSISKGKIDSDKKLNLHHIIRVIQSAAADSKVRGIFLELDAVNAGAASVVEIRNALIDFKASKKIVYAYAEVYSQKSYYLASIADRVF